MKLVAPLCVVALLLLGAGAGPAPATTGGQITGRVAIVEKGKPATRDDVWVYLEDLDRHHHKPRTKPSQQTITQKDRKFTPQVLVVPVGTVIAFPNADHEEHNVFSPTEPTFDLGHYNNGAGRTQKFDDAGEMAIYCDVHQEMWARVKVVESAWISKVNSSGQFSIANVPAGSYKLHVWTYDSAEVIDKVEITDGGVATTSNLNLQLGEHKQSHVDKDGQSYSTHTVTGVDYR